MSSRLTIVASAIAGAMLGATVMFSFPKPGRLESKQAESPVVPQLTRQPVRTLLVWTPGGLPADLGKSVAGLEGVRNVAEVRTGMTWLTSWGKRAAQKPPEGLSIPVEAAAADPLQFGEFLPPSERAMLTAMGEDEALISSSFAALRQMEGGGSLSFGSKTVKVNTVMPDELLGGYEVLFPRRLGESLGIVRSGYLLVAPGKGSSRPALERAVRELLPSGVPVRFRGPGETPVFRAGDAVLPISALKKLFGEFAGRPGPGGELLIDPSWTAANIVSAELPRLGEISCHQKIVPQLTGAFKELVRRGLEGLVKPGDFGGCFSARFLNSDPSSVISHHAWGVAFDLNASDNPFGTQPSIDRRVVEVLERWGFAWGGRWLVPDGMHFEFLRWPVAAEALTKKTSGWEEPTAFGGRQYG